MQPPNPRDMQSLPTVDREIYQISLQLSGTRIGINKDCFVLWVVDFLEPGV